MEKTGEDSYDAWLKIGVAGLKGRYAGKVRIQEKKPPESFTLQAEGKGGPGWVERDGEDPDLAQGRGERASMRVRRSGRRVDRGSGFATRGGGGEEDA